MSKVMRIVFTGRFKETKKQLRAKVEGYGHIWQSSVHHTTDLVVVGYRDQFHIDNGSGMKSLKEREGVLHRCKIIHISSIDDMVEYFV